MISRKKKWRTTQSTLFFHKVHHILTACTVAGSRVYPDREPAVPGTPARAEPVLVTGKSALCSRSVHRGVPELRWQRVQVPTLHTSCPAAAPSLLNTAPSMRWSAFPEYWLVLLRHSRYPLKDQCDLRQWQYGSLCSRLWTQACSFLCLNNKYLQILFLKVLNARVKLIFRWLQPCDGLTVWLLYHQGLWKGNFCNNVSLTKLFSPSGRTSVFHYLWK